MCFPREHAPFDNLFMRRIKVRASVSIRGWAFNETGRFCPSIRLRYPAGRNCGQRRREEDVLYSGMQSRNFVSQWLSKVESKNFLAIPRANCSGPALLHRPVSSSICNFITRHDLRWPGLQGKTCPRSLRGSSIKLATLCQVATVRGRLACR